MDSSSILFLPFLFVGLIFGSWALVDLLDNIIDRAELFSWVFNTGKQISLFITDGAEAN